MASTAQILANRKNAQKSTGPRTEEGKAVAAQNAVKHGLLARGDVIKTEDQGEFDRMREKVLGELDPVGPVETPLAERIVSLMWRLKRAQRLQNEVFEYLMARDADVCAKRINCTSVADPRGDPEFMLGRVVVEDLSNARVIERLGLYERRIEASLYRTIRELRMAKKDKERSEVRDQPATTGPQAVPGRSACPGGTEGEAGRAGIEEPAAGPPTSDLRLDTSDVTPCGVTTNEESCETNPICPGGDGREAKEERESILAGT
jgi:hypothetical protein